MLDAGRLRVDETTESLLGRFRGIEIDLQGSSANLDALPQRRIGAEVRARIDCGPAPLGFVLFGDVIEFVRVHLWRWL